VDLIGKSGRSDLEKFWGSDKKRASSRSGGKIDSPLRSEKDHSKRGSILNLSKDTIVSRGRKKKRSPIFLRKANFSSSDSVKIKEQKETKREKVKTSTVLTVRLSFRKKKSKLEGKSFFLNRSLDPSCLGTQKNPKMGDGGG